MFGRRDSLPGFLGKDAIFNSSIPEARGRQFDHSLARSGGPFSQLVFTGGARYPAEFDPDLFEPLIRRVAAFSPGLLNRLPAPWCPAGFVRQALVFRACCGRTVLGD